MSHTSTAPPAQLLSPAGLSVELNDNGAISRMSHGDIAVNLFVGNELEGGATNLYLRCPGPGGAGHVELLGPRSPTRFHRDAAAHRLCGRGEWRGIRYLITLVLTRSAPAWFWHLSLENTSATAQEIDLIYVQDVALAPYAAVRLNEYYVSQYVDHTPLSHSVHGYVVASRQNQAANGRHPWCAIGSLRHAKSFATDALQIHGLATRAGKAPSGVVQGLPGGRLQHEHSMVALQDATLRIEPGKTATAGFFGWLSADHPAATSPADLSCVDEALALAEATPPEIEPSTSSPGKAPATATLFSAAPLLAVQDLDARELHALFGADWRHEERDDDGTPLSFFYGVDRHVVLREKELRVRRPHGHLLRTGQHMTPDETALTSTAWMGGVFHSMLTQGHVSFNRLLSTVHGYLSLFRSQGQRIFVELDGQWQLLDVPSAFEMRPQECRWIYRHADVTIEVRSRAHSPVYGEPHQLTLEIDVRSGAPARFLISHHIAIDGDDGSVASAVHWRIDGKSVEVAPAPDSDVAQRFPKGIFRIVPAAGTQFESIGGDELLFLDGQSRRQPYLCILIAPTTSVGFSLRGALVGESVDVPAQRADKESSSAVELLSIVPPAGSPLAHHVVRLADILPWYRHNALVHYLSPRGLEQYSGGGWGTRDVTQGPVELLLSVGHTAAVRDLLVRVLRAQSPDGDWPQWFMFFERDRDIRAGDSHGDIVFWPLLALAQYLIASRDSGLLDEPVPFFAPASEPAESGTVWRHVERALAVIQRRVIGGTALAAYGHGDWNDALQPADPALRERMCSAWTVTLHYQTLTTLARALRSLGRESDAVRFETWAENVQRDFQRVLLVDDVLTGYAVFEDQQRVRYVLHPRDELTGVRYSALAMIHAILEGMLTPAQAREHLQLIQTHLSGPDGVRLFDRPLAYHGGPQQLFQRAESATFFGREIGLMYMHAHLRYAQALAYYGDAGSFFRALCQANPIGIRELVPPATLRQANCYYSSSDAAFDDRYQATAEYQRVLTGAVPLDGGWRVYSSGAGIGFSLVVRRFLGLAFEADALVIDPVMPPALDGLRALFEIFGKQVEVVYQIGAAGCGVSAVHVNDRSLPLTVENNPYRPGAARVARTAFVEALNQDRNSMRISTG